MQTHEDSGHFFDQGATEEQRKFMDQLCARAQKAEKAAASLLTAGEPEEEVIDKWKHGKINVVKRADDCQNILRVSVGGGSSVVDLDYCVFRGDSVRCAYLLEQAAAALRNGHEIVRDLT